jgi:hypothetical protein
MERLDQILIRKHLPKIPAYLLIDINGTVIAVAG